jgi:hypothetical protein
MLVGDAVGKSTDRWGWGRDRRNDGVRRVGKETQVGEGSSWLVDDSVVGRFRSGKKMGEQEGRSRGKTRSRRSTRTAADPWVRKAVQVLVEGVPSWELDLGGRLASLAA